MLTAVPTNDTWEYPVFCPCAETEYYPSPFNLNFRISQIFERLQKYHFFKKVNFSYQDKVSM